MGVDVGFDAGACCCCCCWRRGAGGGVRGCWRISSIPIIALQSVGRCRCDCCDWGFVIVLLPVNETILWSELTGLAKAAELPLYLDKSPGLDLCTQVQESESSHSTEEKPHDSKITYDENQRQSVDRKKGEVTGNPHRLTTHQIQLSLVHNPQTG